MGSVEQLEAQPLRGKDLNFSHLVMGTPLHWAAYKENLPVLRWLLRNGADPNFRHPESGMLPLHNAVIKLNPEAVTLLIEYGSEVTEESPSGEKLVNFDWFKTCGDKGEVVWSVLQTALARRALEAHYTRFNPK